MIYFSADDYGLCSASSMRIKQCIDDGALNKVSVFPNFDKVDLEEIQNVRISLHLNLVEGKCMANADEIGLLADDKGSLKNAFGGLLKQSIFHKEGFEKQVYKEIKAQILAWKNMLPEDSAFCVDSHQHTHMIPGVFKTLLKVLEDEEINVEYIRIPTEPVMPFIKTPSLYFSYSGINIIKQWLLKFLWLFNKGLAEKYNIHKTYFFGILFSGNMDIKRVNKILPKYIKLAEKNGKDVEVLFHPGYLQENETDFENKNIAFKKFYLSDGRKTEFDAVMKILRKEV